MSEVAYFNYKDKHDSYPWEGGTVIIKDTVDSNCAKIFYCSTKERSFKIMSNKNGENSVI